MYATALLQPPTPVAHLTTALAIYAYLPMNPCRHPHTSPADLVFFTDTSGKSAPTPITGGATLQLTHAGGHCHVDHHTGHTTYEASSGNWGTWRMLSPDLRLACPPSFHMSLDSGSCWTPLSTHSSPSP